MSKSSTRRRPVARHGQLNSPSAVNQLLKLVGIAVVVVLVSGVGVLGFVAASLTGSVSANAVELDGQKELPPDIAAYEGGFDILLTGVDTCEDKYAHLFGERCEKRTGDATLNDVNLLVHVSAEPRRVTAVSFPRDLMVGIPECTDANGTTRSAMSKQPLNAAYEHGGEKGGLNCVAKTISTLTGEDIEFAAKLTFGGVIEITDAIGGVDVCLANPIKDSATGLDLAAGEHTVQGLQALQFLRTRKGVGDGSDLGRIGNQQQYMSSLARKMISGEVLGNVPVMLRLADTALSNVEASTSLADPMKIVQIALAVKSVPFEDIVFVQYPAVDDPSDPNKVVPDVAAATALWDAISANKQLQITHENTASDGVVVKDPVEGGDATATPTPAPSGEPTDVVALPDSIKGNSAAVQTCSNGNVRG
ncbi:LCP family protein [Microbacterium esteraromaticum]|uniref:LCP family protein n=1 Tax=Microbacterium esteraromaticum TaxID=57043 RepID=UPI002367C02D|nr:LCP family protein [Microbacterium esteraromaticum]WDH79279.1 LCP family protein [Microbacterium esteraromaticum]